jgi:hypothetical protein
MARFHALLFPRPVADPPVEEIVLAGEMWRTLVVTEIDLHRGWKLTWEEAMARLSKLPRLYPEPDGSFVWATDHGRLSGVLYDRNGRMCYAELFGECEWRIVAEFLAACGAPEERFVFQLPEEGVTLEEEEFRELVWKEKSGV